MCINCTADEVAKEYHDKIEEMNDDEKYKKQAIYENSNNNM